MNTPRPLSRSTRAAVALAVIVCVSPAAAHLMKAGHGTLNVVDQKAYAVVSMPVRAFSGTAAAAAVEDGVLTAAELTRHRSTLRAAIREGLTIGVGDRPASFSAVIINLPAGMGHTPGEGDELTVMIVAPLGGDPRTIYFESRLWADRDDALRIMTSVTVDGQVVRSEIGEVTPGDTGYLFFAGAGQVFAGQVRRGLTHLLGGPDHLVFLIVLLIGSMTRRRRIASIGVFTAGCGVAMCAAAAGWAPASPAWVEVVIAASIVVFAAVRLAGPVLRPGVEYGLCAAFAVFHGFGFVAVGGFGHHAPAVKVVGFNVGLWIGVLAVVAALHGARAGVQRLLGAERLPRLALGVAGVGLVLGLAWTVDRVPQPAAEPTPHGQPHARRGASGL